MNHVLTTAAPGDPVGAAAQKMLLFRVRQLVVVERGRPVGIVSDRDLEVAAEAEAEAAAPLLSVRDVMSRHIAQAEPSTTVENALHRVRGRSVSCLVLVHCGEVVGTLTLGNLLEYIVGLGSPQLAVPVRIVVEERRTRTLRKGRPSHGGRRRL